MGEAKRRKQQLGSQYGQSVPVEECAMPAEINLGSVDDASLYQASKNLAQMPKDFISTLYISILKAIQMSEPGVVFAESLKFSGGTGVEVKFRDDIETFVYSRCNVRHEAHALVNKLKSVDYSTHRVLALLAGSTKPILAINIYTLPQLQTQLEALQIYMGTQEESL